MLIRRYFSSLTALLAGSLLACGTLPAQKSIYADYPQKRGKVQPLQWQSLPSWATLTFELRGRTEGQTSYSLTQGNDRVYELTRVYGGLEVRPTKYLTTYLQLIDTHALGLPTHIVASNMRDAFDLRQGYAKVHFTADKVPVYLAAGRRELKFGSERIVGVSDWTNNSRSWDGFFGAFGKDNTLDLFSTSVVAVHPTSLDKHGAGLTFHGGYGSITTLIPHTHVLPFVFVRAVRGVTTPEKAKGNEVETTFGTEIEGSLPGNFDYLLNGALQRGSYANDLIHSGQGIGRLAYGMPKLPWQPRLGVEYNYATGNAHRLPGRVSTYDQLYPSNHNAFGLVDQFGYQNIRQERINLDLGPSKNLSILVQGEFLNVTQRRDNLYASGGTTFLAAPTGGFRSSVIGAGFDASAKYVFHDNVVANIGVGHLFPGALMIQNKKSAETLGFFSLTYRFKFDKHAVKSAGLTD